MQNFYWLNQAIAYSALVIFIIPLRFVKKLFVFAFLGGFIYTWVVQYLAVHIAKKWVFTPDILTLWGIPFFFVMSWFFVTLLFGYLLLKYPKYQIFIVAFFVVWGTLMSGFANYYKQIGFESWSNFETFTYAIFSHVLLLYVFKYMYKVTDLGAKEDMIDFTLKALKFK